MVLCGVVLCAKQVGSVVWYCVRGVVSVGGWGAVGVGMNVGAGAGMDVATGLSVSREHLREWASRMLERGALYIQTIVHAHTHAHLLLLTVGLQREGYYTHRYACTRTHMHTCFY